MVYRKLLFVLMCLTAACGLSAVQRKKMSIPLNINLNIHVHKKPRTKAENGEATKPPVKKEPKLTKRQRQLREQLEARIKALEDQLAVATKEIIDLNEKFQKTPPGADVERLAAQIIALSRQVDELTLKIQQDRERGREPDEATAAAFERLTKRINDLTYDLELAQREAASQKSVAEGSLKQLDGLRVALTAYLIAEEKLLEDYETYRGMSEDASATEATVDAAKTQLALSWQAYTDAVHTLNKVLINVGMPDRRVPINQDYELIVRGALGI